MNMNFPRLFPPERQNKLDKGNSDQYAEKEMTYRKQHRMNGHTVRDSVVRLELELGCLLQKYPDGLRQHIGPRPLSCSRMSFHHYDGVRPFVHTR